MSAKPSHRRITLFALLLAIVASLAWQHTAQQRSFCPNRTAILSPARPGPDTPAPDTPAGKGILLDEDEGSTTRDHSAQLPAHALATLALSSAATLWDRLASSARHPATPAPLYLAIGILLI